MPTLPTTYTWALLGATAAPSSGRQATGWTHGEPPPSDVENWLQQQNGRTTQWLAHTFAVVGGQAMLTLGLTNAGLVASDDGSVATLHLDGSSAGMDTLFRADVVRAGDYFVGGAPGGSTTMYLSSTAPASVGAGGADARVLTVAQQGGTLVGMATAGVLVPSASAAQLAAASVGRDVGVYADNYVKAVAGVSLTQTAGSLALSTGGFVPINAGAPTYPTDRLLIPVLDRAGGRIKGTVVCSVHVGVGGGTVLPQHVSADASYNAGTGNIEVFVSYFDEGTSAWLPIHNGTGNARAVVTVTLY